MLETCGCVLQKLFGLVAVRGRPHASRQGDLELEDVGS